MKIQRVAHSYYKGKREECQENSPYFRGKQKKICAKGKEIFFYDKELIKEDEGIDEEDDDSAIEYCIERCNKQAQVQNACLPQPFGVTCVLEVTFYYDKNGDSINSWEDICTNDWSCENMSTAVCMDANIFNSLVKEGKVDFKVHKYEFFPKLALHYIASIPTENTLFNKDCLSKGELKACEIIMDAGIYIDEIYEASQVDCYEVHLDNNKIFFNLVLN